MTDPSILQRQRRHILGAFDKAIRRSEISDLTQLLKEARTGMDACMELYASGAGAQYPEAARECQKALKAIKETFDTYSARGTHEAKMIGIVESAIEDVVEETRRNNANRPCASGR